MKRLLLLVGCVTVALLPATPLFAKGKAKATPIVHYDTVITKASADSISINENAVPKTFKITQNTEVTVRGTKATVADLKPGMTVSITVGMDPATAARIAAGDAPVHNDPPGAGKGKKK
jgi:hypothetical protein